MHRRRTRRTFSITLGCVIVLFIISLLGGGIFAAYQIFETARQAVLVFGSPNISPAALSETHEPTRANPNVSTGERVNILLLGIERRPSEPCPCQSDTMILATFDPKTSAAGMITIPRDLWLPIPGFGDNRINEAMFYGDLYKYPGGGPALAKQAVEYNLGRKVSYYALVDFAGFRKIIDTLGGLDIDVPYAIDDWQYPTEDYGTMHIHFDKGMQHMDGAHALQYVRTRHQDLDFGRSRRQLQVLMAARDKALKLDLLPKLPLLIQQFWGTVETDLAPQEIIALAAAAARVKLENIRTASIDHTMTVDFRTNGGAQVLWPDRAKIGKLLDSMIPVDVNDADSISRVQSEAASILILNGTSAPLSANTAKFLQTRGFQIAAYGNADRSDYAKTVLIDYSGTKSATVETLIQIFHITPENIRVISDVKSNVDIRLILAADWKPPP